MWQFPLGVIFGGFCALLLMRGPSQRDMVDVLDELRACRLDLAHETNRADEFAHLLADHGVSVQADPIR